MIVVNKFIKYLYCLVLLFIYLSFDVCVSMNITVLDTSGTLLV